MCESACLWVDLSQPHITQTHTGTWCSSAVSSSVCLRRITTNLQASSWVRAKDRRRWCCDAMKNDCLCPLASSPRKRGSVHNLFQIQSALVISSCCCSDVIDSRVTFFEHSFNIHYFVESAETPLMIRVNTSICVGVFAHLSCTSDAHFQSWTFPCSCCEAHSFSFICHILKYDSTWMELCFQCTFVSAGFGRLLHQPSIRLRCVLGGG